MGRENGWPANGSGERPSTGSGERLADGDNGPTPGNGPVISTWLLVGVGAVLGGAVGIGVSLTTDLPLAPEIGALAGGCAGFALARVLNRRA